MYILYAIKFSLKFRGKSIKYECNVANNKLINIACWYKTNRLVLNLSKTNSIHFKLSCRTCSDVDKPVIFLGNVILEYVLVVKYLSMYIAL